jgi:hypothetical protein
MTDFAAHFEGIGMTTAEAHSRAALFRELSARQPRVNGPGSVRFSQGVEISAKHPPPAGGRCWPRCRGIALVARRGRGIVRVGDIRDSQIVEVDPSASAARVSQPAPIRHVVARRLF